MDNKDSGSNLAVWLPGSAVIISLVVSTFALTRPPLVEVRPAGAQLQLEYPVEARLWQDPFDALERYRKKLKDKKGTGADSRIECNPTLFVSSAGQPRVADANVTPEPTSIMVALVEGGPYADEVELRRRMRYAIQAGFKNANMVPADEQHIHCLALATNLRDYPQPTDPGLQKNEQQNVPEQRAEIPYETFVDNPFDLPPLRANNARQPRRTILFWVKHDYLDDAPLERLDSLRETLSIKLYGKSADVPPMKVIGPSNSKVLREMYRQEAEGKASPHIEIYSPLATAERQLLVRGFETDLAAAATPEKPNSPASEPRASMNLLRTISNDRELTKLLLDELDRRRVDIVTAVQCSRNPRRDENPECKKLAGRPGQHRIALISEWDSFYSRALAESFKSEVAERAEIDPNDKLTIDGWVLRFSYLRGLDGFLPEESASGKKPSEKPGDPLDTSPLEKADGNSQLDYLRRLADHIAKQDKDYRRRGESGIGAIGVVGTDAYDKLLVLQALKSVMPNKLYFSTDLDARMLQRGQAQTARNLVLAAPYGLALSQNLQRDVPPFRDSLQSAVFVAVLVAQAPQSFHFKRRTFDYSDSALLSPGLYEVGTHGFIPLKSSKFEDCDPTSSGQGSTEDGYNLLQKDITRLLCLQEVVPPAFPELSEAALDRLRTLLSMWWAWPLCVILLVLVIFRSWWRTADPLNASSTLPQWVRYLPFLLYTMALLSAFYAWWGRLEFLWATFLLLPPGIFIARINSRQQATPAPASDIRSVSDPLIYYILVPAVVFFLAIAWTYQHRVELTDGGLGEPMYLFEGISAWPTYALRLLAVLMSISALVWAGRKLRRNRREIEDTYHLRRNVQGTRRMVPWSGILPFGQGGGPRTARGWLTALGRCLYLIFFPLSPTSLAWIMPRRSIQLVQTADGDQRPVISFMRFWRQHCLCSSFIARTLRAALATWIFLVVTSVLVWWWPIEGAPFRGEPPMGRWNWMLPNLVFQLLVFWVVDANYLLTRFIRQLSSHHALWPRRLQAEHQKIFGIREHACIDDWVDIMLIAKRSAAVNRLIYAPTVVLLILIASRSSVFDNWPTPPSMIISYLLTALLLFSSAMSLRRAAEQARGRALQNIDDLLLKRPLDKADYAQFEIIRNRIAALSTGAFSRYSEEPLVRALLVSLTGLGGSVIVDVLNYSKF